MRKIARTVGLSLTAAVLCFGAVACSSGGENTDQSRSSTQEQLTKRTSAEAKKTLDGFFAKVSSETAGAVKSASPDSSSSGVGSAGDITDANLAKLKAGFPASYAYLDEASLGKGGAVKVVAIYAQINASAPGTVLQSKESGFKIDGNSAYILGTDIQATKADGKPSDAKPGYIGMTFVNGEWKISDFSENPTLVPQ